MAGKQKIHLSMTFNKYTPKNQPKTTFYLKGNQKMYLLFAEE